MFYFYFIYCKFFFVHFLNIFLFLDIESYSLFQMERQAEEKTSAASLLQVDNHNKN